MVVAEHALGLDDLGHRQPVGAATAGAEVVHDLVAAGRGGQRAGVEALRREGGSILASLGGAERRGDQHVIPLAADCHCGTLGILALGVHDGLEFVEPVDQLVELALDREHPPAGEVVGSVLLRLIAAGRRLRDDRVQLLERARPSYRRRCVHPRDRGEHCPFAGVSTPEWWRTGWSRADIGPGLGGQP